MAKEHFQRIPMQRCGALSQEVTPATKSFSPDLSAFLFD
jgi:hypothetical protein